MDAEEFSRRPLSFIEPLPPHEALFWRYVYHWGEHPDSRPAAYKLLKFAVDGSGNPDLELMLVFSRDFLRTVES